MGTKRHDPFSGAKAYHIEARFYKIKGKDMTGGDDVPVMVSEACTGRVNQTRNPTKMRDYRDLSLF